MRDRHANHVALGACLEWMDDHSVDGIVFLGDYVTVALIRRGRSNFFRILRRATIRGSYGATGKIICWSTDVIQWAGNTYENLDRSALDWFESMPQTFHIHIDGCEPLFACHCPSCYSYRQQHPPKEKLHETLGQLNEPVLLCAHSHVP